MYENRWSPFDPKWYQEAFDKSISTGDQLFNQQTIIDQGYHVPDADGSRSSVFRDDAVLNNSFNEKHLRESLRDIYLNSTHKMKASNHDNTHFYQWCGTMKDVTFIPNTQLCEIKLPVDSFIYSKDRDKFKLSQYYRKWIKIEDVLNNWDIFKWCCLVFIDQKIYSDYELRIDDHEVTIRFQHFKSWTKNNSPIYIYRMDTNAQCRIKISRELVVNQWNWEMPVEYIGASRVVNSRNIMVAFNRITTNRADGNDRVDVIGDNLEFLSIEDGHIDLSYISAFNKAYIMNELTEWIWMSIIVPKFIYEYPILLPTDSVYRPYEANWQRVYVTNQSRPFGVHSDEKNVYVDLNNELTSHNDGWKQMIRPIVLSDAYDGSNDAIIYESMSAELNKIKQLTIECADMSEEFRIYTMDNSSNSKYIDYVDRIDDQVEKIKTEYESYMRKRYMDADPMYMAKYRYYKSFVENIRNKGAEDYYFRGYTQDEETNYWFILSPMIYIPRELVDRYIVFTTMDGMGRLKNMWNDDSHQNKIRFQRPIDVSDFWTFEYNADTQVWRPYPLNIEHHFPDVYIATDPNQETPGLNRIFKTFLFYSDTMNVRNEESDIIHATPSWDKDMENYHYDREGTYRDIFMEKFYWMGIRSIYKGLLMTQCRWEALEYIIDNPSYERFNDLFMKTMDPYFKLGLATYLKSSNYNFPFDDAINKMQESINVDWLGYRKVSNFELYLDKDWVPSYFDYVTKIMDDWNYGDRLIRRPRSTFDIERMLPTFIDAQTAVHRVVYNVTTDIGWLVGKLNVASSGINIDDIIQLNECIEKLYEVVDGLLTYIRSLDLEIYSIDDINHILGIVDEYHEVINEINKLYSSIYEDVVSKDIWSSKRKIIEDIGQDVQVLPEVITNVSKISQSFDMNAFMLLVNDLRSYESYPKYNPGDNSLIGKINAFTDNWSDEVKTARDDLFKSTVLLHSLYDSDKSYTRDEIDQFKEILSNVDSTLDILQGEITHFWLLKKLDTDESVLNHITQCKVFLKTLVESLNDYLTEREKLMNIIDDIYEKLDNVNEYHLNENEIECRKKTIDDFESVIAALSYIAGTNKRMDAIESLDRVKSDLASWLELLSIEEEVFYKLYSLSKEPVIFLQTLQSYDELLGEICVYLKTADTIYKPDSDQPTYSDIYEIDEIEMTCGGFLHEVGDIVYVPKLGVYEITSVEGNVSKAESIKPVDCRLTTFRNPLWQNNIYDTITNGPGMAITVKPISSKHTVILNDTAADQYLVRIKNAIIQIERNIESYNPHENINMQSNIDSIHNIKSDWGNMLTNFKSYMSSDVVDEISDVINKLLSMEIDIKSFMDNRQSIDIENILANYEKFIFTGYDYIKSLDKQTETFSYYDESIRVAYNKLLDFYGNGTSWTDGPNAIQSLDDLKSPLRMYYRNIISPLEESDTTIEMKSVYDLIFSMISTTIISINNTPNSILPISYSIKELTPLIEEIPDMFKSDEWFSISNIRIGVNGIGYTCGDIIRVVPELPTDIRGNPIDDKEDIILNDSIYLQITRVDDMGGVIDVKPFMEYALPYSIWGIRKTETCVGNGNGLVVDIYTHRLDISDSTIFGNTNNPPLNKFDENDLITFKFENIHDLDITYDVFIGGKQINNFIRRHETSSNPMQPGQYDVLYIKANDVIRLQDSSVYIPAEKYFVYKIHNTEIVDPGAGYAVGQDVYIDTESSVVKLRVASLTNNSLKGIQSLTSTLEYNSGLFIDQDPACESGSVITDSMNNIDDEFNVGYYDKITKDGIQKSVTTSTGPYALDDFIYVKEISKSEINEMWSNNGAGYINPTDTEINRGRVKRVWKDDYNNYREPLDTEINRVTFQRIWDNPTGYVEPVEEKMTWQEILEDDGSIFYTAIRYDNLENGDRNATYMYPDVDLPDGAPSNGDSDTHVYVGGRIDNSQHPMEDPRRWNGIMNAIPPTNPFIPDDRRFPTGQDPKGEYQFIQKLRIHSSEAEINDDVTRKFPNSLLNSAMVKGDLVVNDYTDLPEHLVDWPEGRVGKVVIVSKDSSHGNHRMAYKIRTFVAAGFFVYDIPEIADIEWRTFDITWLDIDSYKDYPSINTQYPDAPWRNSPSYQYIQREILDGVYKRKICPGTINNSTYIHNVSVDDISVFNYTTKEWEDLHDTTRWKLDVKYDDEGNQTGFILTFITDVHYSQIYVKEIPLSEVKYIWDNDGMGYVTPIDGEIDKPKVENIWELNGAGYIDPTDAEIKNVQVRTIWETNGDGYVEPKEELWGTTDIDPDDIPPYSYDMRLYLNKTSTTQSRNAELKRNAIIKVTSDIAEEVNNPAVKMSVNTGRHLRIRKMLPYEQRESYKLGFDKDKNPLGYEMNFRLAPYMHFKNEIHLEDIKIYNKSAGRFENILDTSKFEVRFKDPKSIARGYETQTNITRVMIDKPGNGFINGLGWAYNEEFNTHVFGRIEADIYANGTVISFTPVHFVNPPEENVMLYFDLYQYDGQSRDQGASVIMQFNTEKVEVFGDGYIHNVTNRLAPIPKEFKVIVLYDLDGVGEYDIIISKSSKTWTFVEPYWRMSPTFYIPDENIQQDRLYTLTDNGRFPLVNPSTGKPTLSVEETENGTNVTFLNLYRRYEKLEIHSTPYPMRSVYVQRHIPKSGYINLYGKINKPLNKKYFEFWVNGKLLHDEVTIITPTKIFLHGLTSLKNFELIEINRDSNEYFSDEFLTMEKTSHGRPYPRWNFRTYLDDALEGTLDKDNYTTEEQEYLLTPVWKQINEDHPEFKNYPPNIDIDDDILVRTNPEDYPIDDVETGMSYQFLVVDQPTIEGHQIIEQTLTFESFGFKPIDEDMLMDMMNEEWKDEIENNPYFPKHYVMSDDEWYGMTTRLYDEYGVQVHNLNDVVYRVTEPSLLTIRTDSKLARIIPQTISYDLD